MTVLQSQSSSSLILSVVVVAAAAFAEGIAFEVGLEVGSQYSDGRFFDGICSGNVTECFLQQVYDSNTGAYTNEGDSFACLAPSNTNTDNPDFDRDDTLILCDCHEDNGFFLDYDPATSAGLFRWTVDENICLQAGHSDNIVDGSKIRLYPCDRSEPRQVLWYVSDGQVRLQSNPKLCMVPQGSQADMCQSTVIVKECDSISPERRSWQYRKRETLIRQTLGPIINAEQQEQTPFPNSVLQEEALNWLVYEDMAKIPEGPVETYQLLQRYISAVLYFGTDGPNWFNNSMWLSFTSVCEWDGISCTGGEEEEPDTEFIDSYDLNNNGLVGELPSEIGTLSELLQLDLSENILFGTVPPQLGNLMELTSLSLACNSLTGFVPESLTNLDNLEDLCLSGNDFNSTVLPGGLGEIPCLSATEECKEAFDEDIDVEISRANDAE